MKKIFFYPVIIYIQLTIQLIITLLVSLDFKDIFSLEVLSFFNPYFLIMSQIYNFPYLILSLLLYPIYSFYRKKNKGFNFIKQVLLFIAIVIGLYFISLLIGFILNLLNNGSSGIINEFYVWPLDNSKNEIKRLLGTYLLGNIIFSFIYVYLHNKILKKETINP